jgi:hypothetical protein
VKEVHGHRGDMRGRHRGGHWDDVKEHKRGERGRI